MALDTSSFARIVVGFDDSLAADAALQQAVVLAEQYSGEIIAVHVADFSAAVVLPVTTSGAAAAFDARPILNSLQDYERRLFEKLSDRVARCTVPVRVEFSTNGAAAGILDAAIRWNATAIAVGTHARRGVSRLFMGSVADEVLRGAGVAVIVAREGTVRKPLERAIVGIDASEPSANAGLFAVAIGVSHHVRLVFCTVTDTASLVEPNADLSFNPTPLLSEMRASARNALDTALQYANSANVFPDTDIIESDDVGAGLCAAARRHDADAIIVGSHRRSELERFFVGSTAKAVILEADRTVIVIPPHAELLAGAVQRPNVAVV